MTRARLSWTAWAAASWRPRPVQGWWPPACRSDLSHAMWAQADDPGFVSPELGPSLIRCGFGTPYSLTDCGPEMPMILRPSADDLRSHQAVGGVARGEKQGLVSRAFRSLDQLDPDAGIVRQCFGRGPDREVLRGGDERLRIQMECRGKPCLPQRRGGSHPDALDRPPERRRHLAPVRREAAHGRRDASQGMQATRAVSSGPSSTGPPRLLDPDMPSGGGGPMAAVLHGSAWTAPRVRAELHASKGTTSTLAQRHGPSRTALTKWRPRTATSDAPTGPDSLHTAGRRRTRAAEIPDPPHLIAQAPGLPSLLQQARAALPDAWAAARCDAPREPIEAIGMATAPHWIDDAREAGVCPDRTHARLPARCRQSTRRPRHGRACGPA